MHAVRSALGDFEDEVRRTLADAAYAAAHPEAAQALDAAFVLLWSGKTDDEVLRPLGDYLRDALLYAIRDLIGDPPRGPDHPILRLREFLRTSRLPTREAKVMQEIVELVRVSLRLDYRISSVHEQTPHSEPPATWDEVRRAAFATAFACYELDRLTNRRITLP